MPGDLVRVVPDSLRRSDRVMHVELCGSRARGDAGPFSDWDFVVATDDFDGLAQQLPELVAELGPMARLWDRLSDYQCYMFILPGPTKVDLIFGDEPHADDPPWVVSKDTLSGIDDHFWDWTLWLTSKVHSGNEQRVDLELSKMHQHLLGPMGEERPASLPDAVTRYLSARHRWSERLAITLDDRLGRAVRRVVDDLYSAR